jgi:preflagellin peptidase FlaK
MIVSSFDAVRLSLLPLLVYAGYQDYRERRVSNWIWKTCIAVGAAVVVAEIITLMPISGEADVKRVQQLINLPGVMMFVGGIMAHVRRTGFGDAKAVIAVGVLYPTVPSIQLMDIHLPVVVSSVPSLGLIAVINAVLIGSWFIIRGLIRGASSTGNGGVLTTKRTSPVGEIVKLSGLASPVSSSDGGRFTVDIDTIRMYLRWRGITIEQLKNHSDELSNPDEIATTYDVSDGAIWKSEGAPPSNELATEDRGVSSRSTEHDRWGVELFYSQVEADLYDDSKEELRHAIDYIEGNDTIVVSEEYPFVSLVSIGLITGTVIGALPGIFV